MRPDCLRLVQPILLAAHYFRRLLFVFYLHPRLHPQLTFHPLEWPTYDNCSICNQPCLVPKGQPDGEICMHKTCQLTKKSLDLASWSSYDSHSLVLFILHLNSRTPLTLPEKMVRKFFAYLDHELEPAHRRWPATSYAFRCNMAVSSLYGILKHPVTIKLRLPSVTTEDNLTRYVVLPSSPRCK